MASTFIFFIEAAPNTVLKSLHLCISWQILYFSPMFYFVRIWQPLVKLDYANNLIILTKNKSHHLMRILKDSIIHTRMDYWNIHVATPSEDCTWIVVVNDRAFSWKDLRVVLLALAPFSSSLSRVLPTQVCLSLCLSHSLTLSLSLSLCHLRQFDLELYASISSWLVGVHWSSIADCLLQEHIYLSSMASLQAFP